MTDEKTWKPLELIKVTAEYLTGKGVPGARLDAETLLCNALNLKRRVDLYTGFENNVSGKNLATYRELVRRRSLREPVSRILGHREFMGIPFLVTPDVLSPRPETELLVEAVIDLVNPQKNTPAPAATETPEEETTQAHAALLNRLLDNYAENMEDEKDIDRAAPVVFTPPPPAPLKKNMPKHKKKPPATPPRPVSVLDLGTGSGCIAVSLAAHLPATHVVAVDASPKTLAVAKKNAAAANVADRVDFRQGDWFAACRDGETFDFIVSNPPYLVEGDPDIWPEVAGFDPPLALYSGKDGLDCYRRIVPDAAARLAPSGQLLLEVGAGQAKRVAEMLLRRGFRDVGVTADYGGVERVVTGKRPEKA